MNYILGQWRISFGARMSPNFGQWPISFGVRASEREWTLPWTISDNCLHGSLHLFGPSGSCSTLAASLRQHLMTRRLCWSLLVVCTRLCKSLCVGLSVSPSHLTCFAFLSNLKVGKLDRLTDWLTWWLIELRARDLWRSALFVFIGNQGARLYKRTSLY